MDVLQVQAQGDPDDWFRDGKPFEKRRFLSGLNGPASQEKESEKAEDKKKAAPHGDFGHRIVLRLSNNYAKPMISNGELVTHSLYCAYIRHVQRDRGAASEQETELGYKVGTELSRSCPFSSKTRLSF